ncbi:glycosyltransferase [Rhodocytophaga rosea]|uniref:Glycosyltransferase n=1 Tax=Rhodocytophaga rosea TaxID=2704465 RepID=A0A6C0GSZ3_9BACT|nr:glycosyltransferase family 4 protein [Rhodocytophaga rosea]QHT71146.1 glycosyltransferase [Rhodocytophaga rosea]
MKVTLVNTFQFSGGAAVACYRLMQALNKNQVDASLLVQQQSFEDASVESIGDSFPGKQKAWLRFSADRFYFMLHEKNKGVRFAFSPANIGTDISQHPFIQQADIIHLHWINFGFLSLDSLQQLIDLGKPIVWTMHDMWAFTGGCHYSGECKRYLSHCHSCPFLRNPHPKDLSYRVFENKFALLANASISFVACSQWLAGLAKDSRLLKEFPIISIPNPIDTSTYTPANKTVVRKALSLPTNKKLILFGAFKITDPRKGFIYLLQALHLLQEKYPETSEELGLLVFGKTDQALMEELPFPVFSLGTITETSKLVQVYNAASVFVLPSLEDNLPNTVMESLSCGTPVVAFDTGGLPEMISHLSTGYLSEYKSAESLAEGIYEVLFKQDYTTLSRSARQKVLDTYSESAVAEKYKALYKNLLG